MCGINLAHMVDNRSATGEYLLGTHFKFSQYLVLVADLGLFTTTEIWHHHVHENIRRTTQWKVQRVVLYVFWPSDVFFCFVLFRLLISTNFRFAYIEFENYAIAQNAIQAMNNQQINGKTCT